MALSNRPRRHLPRASLARKVLALLVAGGLLWSAPKPVAAAQTRWPQAPQLLSNGVLDWGDPTECPCDSWGVADANSRLGAVFGRIQPLPRTTPAEVIAAVTRLADDQTATVQVSIDPSDPGRVVRATHHVVESSSDSLELRVVITNPGERAVPDVRYRRSIRWSGAMVDQLTAREGAASVRLLGQAADPHPMNDSSRDPTTTSIDLAFGRLEPDATLSFTLIFLLANDLATMSSDLADHRAEVFLAGHTLQAVGTKQQNAYVALGAANVGGAPFVLPVNPAGSTAAIAGTIPSITSTPSVPAIATATPTDDAAETGFALPGLGTSTGAARNTFDETTAVVLLIAGIFGLLLVAGSASRLRALFPSD